MFELCYSILSVKLYLTFTNETKGLLVAPVIRNQYSQHYQYILYTVYIIKLNIDIWFDNINLNVFLFTKALWAFCFCFERCYKNKVKLIIKTLSWSYLNYLPTLELFCCPRSTRLINTSSSPSMILEENSFAFSKSSEPWFIPSCFSSSPLTRTPLEPSLGFEAGGSSGLLDAETTSGARRAESLSHPECVCVCVYVKDEGS